ncbi:TPA: hypothetical protein UMV35_000061 [Stenotrophomonas maltophilia]|uniref:hypothetical protein n=1 Tax=Stenotrophomonas TaxID=40323 RepID=UPI0013DD010D|nr:MULTISPECIES: hypothetical protein [Stenotrophomonas]MBH1593542.1 hypothetical protein [Stenotrophomonas maltophilia]MDH2021253.1 hypothetical protein [Stenotrophomonas sp. GD03680]HEL3747830.1 hypothetical protein [Stenotrophomonas maltophilia]HEL7728784.1 hypothetical protein [Stenotrophomonas maltophilia]
MDRFTLFIEVVRTMDYWGINAYPGSSRSEEIKQSLDLMYWGWNRAVAELFEPLDEPGAFPLMESTQESRSFAAGLMQEFGKVSLARRLADMGERGIMEIVKDGSDFQIRMSVDARSQLSDVMEVDRLKAAEDRASSSNSGWTMATMRDAVRSPWMPGNYLAVADVPMKRWLRADLEELIKPLVRPWDTGRGIMVAYDARIEVDKHYMAEALALATPWRDESGIHAYAKLGLLTGADVAGIGAALISLHAKHFGCVSVAKKLFPEVSVAQSLTIWGPRDSLEESISLMSGSSESMVRAAFNVLAMTSGQAKKLADHSTPLIPLLFDLGNGFILRPVSCLTRNPFTAARIQHHWLDPRTEHAVAADREEWMRQDLYYMFGGQRYIRFPGNLKLRRGGTVLTDIDAIIYDRATGDVGLFQLKWQDYSTNDVRQLRSKAVNLAAELADWSAKVKSWIEENGVSALDQSLRLKQKRREAVKGVLLFAISKSSVRTQGYGVSTEAPGLAMAVWPQFVRARMEIGPSRLSLRDIHARLIEEYGQTPDIHPMPASVRMAGITLQIHDFWNKIKE